MKTKKKKKYPPQIEASVQYALSRQKLGMAQEAASIYQSIISQYPDHPDANHLYGVILYGIKNYKSAVTHIKTALQTSPKNAEYLHNLGLVYKDTGNLSEAKKLFNLAIKADRQYSYAYNSQGAIFLQENKIAEAIMHFKKAIKANPNYNDAKFNLANANFLSGCFEKAILEYEELLVVNPGDKEIILNLGECYMCASQPEKAIVLFESVINSPYTCDEYLYKISEVYEAFSNLDKALEWIEKSREKNADDERSIYLHGVIKRRKGMFDEARLLLEKIKLPLDDNALTQKIFFELGRLHDRLGNYDTAFENYSKGNLVQKNNTDKLLANKERFLDHLKLISDNLSYEWLASWRDCELEMIDHDLVFMVAFPRSGTTLLDQILDGHSCVQVMEEQPILGSIIEKIVSKNNDYPNCLAHLSCKEVSKFRKYYMDQVAQYVSLQPNSTVIDKLPLNIVEIELIQRLFPEAKIILSLRHPYDVCLSNFMQHFELNDAMSNFLTLEDTAYAYRQVMELWQNYTKVMPLIYKTVRYEDLIEDTEGEARALAEFLDLEWEHGMLNHSQHAKTRKINTPSYQQVTEKIYNRSKYRWKNYEKHLNTISEDLKTLIQSFGYTA